MNKTRNSFLAALMVGLILPVVAWSHHSRAHFSNEIVEMDGELVEVRWQNPHVTFRVRATDAAGETAVWELESGSIYMLNRFENLSQDAFNAGDSVRIAGQVSRRTDHLMLVTNMLLPDGTEQIMLPNQPLRWTDATSDNQAAETLLADNPQRSIFRVWSTAANRNPGGGIDRSTLSALRIPPLTPAGEQAMASIDPEEAEIDPEANCVKPGMPAAMFTPQPIQFIDDGDYISLHIQENNVVRTIRIEENGAAAEASPSPLGYSVGRWEGTTLVVRTNNISWPFYNNAGVPLSPQVFIDERFEISEDGSRLTHTMVTTDPVNLAEPASEVTNYVLLGEEIYVSKCVPMVH